MHYVAQIVDVESGEFSVSYLRMCGKYGLNDTVYTSLMSKTLGELGRDSVRFGGSQTTSEGEHQKTSQNSKVPHANYWL